MSTPTLPPELNPRGPQARTSRPARPSTAVPRVSRARRWPVVVSGTLAVLVLVFSVVGSGLASYYESQTKRVDVITGGSSSGAQNWLLVGSDNRAGLSRAEIDRLHVGGASTQNSSGRRSDTMILLHLSAGDDKATLVSLPRDSYVTIPPYTDDQGKHHAASHAKLNAAYEFGGAALTVRTVQLATGLHIDHYVEVGFGGFVRMVDALGGVPVCSTTPLKDPKSGLDIPAGITKLNGVEALKYVRARYVDPTADLGRMKRQQAFLGSVFRTALSTQTLLNPLKLNSFLTAALSSVTLDRGLSRDDLVNLATATRGLSPSNVVFTTVPLSNVNYNVPGLGSTVLWDRTKAAALFGALKKDHPVGGQSTHHATTSAAGVRVAPSHITVQVENGAGIAGLGARAANDLQQQGYAMAGPATNATVTGVTTTRILYDPGYNVSVLTLEAAFPGAQATPVKGQGKTFVVIVGSSYQPPKAVTVSAASTGSSTANPGGVRTTNAGQTVCKTS